MKDELIVNICKYIDSHIKEEIRIDDLSSTFYFDRYYLMRLFKKEMGVTIVDYINTKRVLNSMPPLVYTDDKILKIALDNGFNSAEYYCEQFNKVVGMSPINFRKLSTTYDVTSLFEGDVNMENNRLLVLKKEIEDLRKLREEISGTNTKEENTKDKPKVYTLLPKVDKKTAA